jgi:hypothetical protein
VTHKMIDVPGRNSSQEFVGRAVRAIKSDLVERFRRWRKYRTVAAAIRQYSASENVELGISRANMDYIAGEILRRGLADWGPRELSVILRRAQERESRYCSRSLMRAGGS